MCVRVRAGDTGQLGAAGRDGGSTWPLAESSQGEMGGPERELFIDNLLVRIHFIIEMIRWTGLAPLEFEFTFPGSRTYRVRKGGCPRLEKSALFDSQRLSRCESRLVTFRSKICSVELTVV